MVCLDEQVAVVRPHLNAMQDLIVSLADFPKDSFQLNFNHALKYLMTVFGAKDNVIPQTMLGV